MQSVYRKGKEDFEFALSKLKKGYGLKNSSISDSLFVFETHMVALSSSAPSSPHSPADEPPDRGFFIRMKSTLTKRGLHVKSSGYKVQMPEEKVLRLPNRFLY